ncbi:hypothetical protein IJ22_49810 [Paenibacillus naphthalenovorans]|uniref:Uncharacterized protein n=1 Tax=Paenibacillus naphthalenovorans TaxID=162209 RepID=A0A0U2INT1_9BACL|nr:hypothetical protein IJ22_49810 [Paenibacillus naphthalenovorans]SDI31575.1 hypothetical protein SAMN05421868_10563 [Paenibacillus naphthalenovorans]
MGGAFSFLVRSRSPVHLFDIGFNKVYDLP